MKDKKRRNRDDSESDDEREGKRKRKEKVAKSKAKHTQASESDSEPEGRDKSEDRHRRREKDGRGKDRKREKEVRNKREDAGSSSGEEKGHGKHRRRGEAREGEEEEAEGRTSAERIEDCLRAVMTDFPLDVMHDLLQILERVDQGTAADISGIPDTHLKKRLKRLFRALSLKHPSSSSSRGRSTAYGLTQGAPPTMPRVAPIVASLLAAKPSAAAAAIGTATNSTATNGTATNGPATQGTATQGTATNGTQATEAGALTERDGAAHAASVQQEAAAPEIGPAPRPPSSGAGGASEVEGNGTGGDRNGGGVLGAESGAREAEVASQGAVAKEGPAKRSMGPAMPSRDQLEAAARLTAATQALRDAEAELEMSAPLIGPPPPAAVAEASSATDAMKNDQVARLLRHDITPYEALEVKREATPSELKKSYWKLSLLVHPDKCPHADAAQAFQVLSSALKALSDPQKKAAIDAKLDAAAERKALEAEFQAMKEAAEWRRLRGAPEEGDEELLRPTAGPGGPGLSRDEWMTELPPERQAARAPQTNTFFSKKEKTGRGDTSEWTDTPQLKAEKARKMFIEAQAHAQAALEGPSEADIRRQHLQAAAAAAEAEALGMPGARQEGAGRGGGGGGGGSGRQLSLVEQHQKKMREEERQRKRARKAEHAARGGKGKVADAEWRPWDRERDLEIKPKSLQLTKDGYAGGLSSRFGGTSSGPRSFL